MTESHPLDDPRVLFHSPLPGTFSSHQTSNIRQRRKAATAVRPVKAASATDFLPGSADAAKQKPTGTNNDGVVKPNTALPRSLSADYATKIQPQDEQGHHHRRYLRHFSVPGRHKLAAQLSRFIPQELTIERNADRRDSYIVEQDSLRTFLDETQWHGVKRMGMQTRFGFFAYWWVVVLVCYSLCFALIGVTIRDMISNPLRTSITTDEPYYQMPVYYLCDSNQVWLRKLRASPYKQLQPILEQYVMAMWKKTTTSEFETNFLDSLRNNNANGSDVYALLSSSSFEEFVKLTRPDYKQVELMCLYDRQSCKAAGILSKDVWLLGRGWCRVVERCDDGAVQWERPSETIFCGAVLAGAITHRYGSRVNWFICLLQTAYYFTRNCDYVSGINSLIAGRGCKRSLDLIVRLDPTDNWLGQTLTLIDEFTPSFQRYLTILTSFNRYANASNVANNDAAIVDLNDDYEDVLPTYSSLYTDDTHLLSVGTFKSLASAYHFYTGSAAGNCAGDELAYQACLTKCYMASLQRLSKCRLFSQTRASAQSLGACSIKDILSGMLLHIGQSPSLKDGHVLNSADYYSATSDGGPASHFDSGRSKSHSIPHNMLQRRKTSTYFKNCTCQRPCQRHYYHSRATEARSPSNRGARLLQILIPELAGYKPESLKEFVSVLKLELSSVTREKVSVDSVISIQNFFSNIGGQLGLLVGGSLITVFETTEWFLRYIWVCFRRF